MTRNRTMRSALNIAIVIIMVSPFMVDVTASLAGDTRNGQMTIGTPPPDATETASRAEARAHYDLPSEELFMDPPNENRVLPIYTGPVTEAELENFDDLGVGGLVINSWQWNDTMMQIAEEKNWTMWVNDYYMYPSGNANPYGGVHETFWNPSFEKNALGLWPDGWFWSYNDWPVVDNTGAKAHSGAYAVAADDVNCYFWAIGVEAGTSYNLSGWARAEPGSDQGRILIRWYNIDTEISFDYAIFKVDSNYSHFHLEATAPPGATSAKLLIQGHERDKFVWFDDMMFRPMDPFPVDLLLNGDFEEDIDMNDVPDGWGNPGNPFYDHNGSNSHTGNAAVMVNGSRTFQQIFDVTEGRDYYHGLWMRNTTGNHHGEIAWIWLNATYQMIGAEYRVMIINSSWTYHEIMGRAPAGAEHALAIIVGVGDQDLWADDAVFYELPPTNQGVPSGPVLDGHPELEAQGLYYGYMDIVAPATANMRIPNGQLVSAVAAQVSPQGVVDMSNVQDLSGNVVGGNIIWTPSSGTWRVMAFTVDILYYGTEVDPALSNMHQINVMNEVAVQGFIDSMYDDTIYTSHGEHFGSTIKASFTDEVSNLGGYFMQGMRYPMVAWLQDDVNGLYMTDAFQSDHGYDIVDHLPALFNDVGPTTSKYRVDFYDTAGRMQGETYYKMTGDWCEDHEINFSGHLLSEESLVSQTAFYGDLWASIKYMGYPGMDTLLHRAGDLDNELIIPKTVSSAAVLYEKPHAMTEYSVSSDSIGYRNMTAVINWEAVQGIDTVTSFSFYRGWMPDDQLRAHSEHVGRTNYMLQQGDYRTDVAVLYPTVTAQAGYTPHNQSIWNTGASGWGSSYDNAFHALTKALLGNQTDFIYMNDESLLGSEIVNTTDGTVLHHGMSGLDIKVLVIPDMRVIRTETLVHIKVFLDAGGLVLAVGELPRESDENGVDPAVEDTLRSMFRTSSVGPNGYSQLTNENGGIGMWPAGDPDAAIAAIRDHVDSDLVIYGAQDPAIYYMKREASGFTMYYIVNNAPSPSIHDYIVEGIGDPTGWDPETGEVTGAVGTGFEYIAGKGVTLIEGLEIGGFSSIFIVMKKPEISIDAGNMTHDPAEPVVGDLVTIELDVTNIGPGHASVVRVEMFDSDRSGNDTQIGKTKNTTIGPGDTITLTFIWDTAGSPGLRDLVAFACLPPMGCVNVSKPIYVNTPPKPVIAYTKARLLTGDTVLLNGSASSDIDGPIVLYEWDLGDGNSTMGEEIEHAYEENGEYNVTLTVTDTNGTTNSTTAVIPVMNRVPEVGISVRPAEGDSMTKFEFEASVTDDGNIVNYTWDMGDGTLLYGGTALHVFGRPGNFTISLTVIDDDGSKAMARTNVSLDNLVPRANMTVEPATGYVTTEFAINSTSYDRDGRIVDIKWDLGDGTNATGASVRHTYDDDGSYFVSLRVSDDLGSWSNNITTKIVVKNLAPVARATPIEQTIIVGENLNLSAAGSTDPDDAASELSFEWDFGDGSIPATGMEQSHIYEKVGDFKARLTVTDDNGASSTVTVQVHVLRKEDGGGGTSGSDGDTDLALYAGIGIIVMIVVIVLAFIIINKRSRGDAPVRRIEEPVPSVDEEEENAFIPEDDGEEPEEEGYDDGRPEEDNIVGTDGPELKGEKRKT